MTQELRKLAEAAKGWLIRPSIVQETADDILKLGHTSEDGEFYELIEIDCENYGQPSRPLAEFIAAANPAAILALIDRLEKAEKDAERLLPLLKQALSVVDGSYNEDYDEAFEGSVSEALRAEISAMEASKWPTQNH